MPCRPDNGARMARHSGPDAVEQTHADFAHQADGDDIPRPVRARIARPDEVPTPEELDLRQRLIAQRAEPSTTGDRPHP